MRWQKRLASMVSTWPSVPLPVFSMSSWTSTAQMISLPVYIRFSPNALGAFQPCMRPGCLGLNISRIFLFPESPLAKVLMSQVQDPVHPGLHHLRVPRRP